jgi:antitoxin (DNA-binding transcriptional repressor) of toxin-antitoxin stability system
MYHRQDELHRNARNVRANLSDLCHAEHATVILNQGRPVAILTPIDTTGLYTPGPKDRKFAAAKKRFHAALERLRTR